MNSQNCNDTGMFLHKGSQEHQENVTEKLMDIMMIDNLDVVTVNARHRLSPPSQILQTSVSCECS